MRAAFATLALVVALAGSAHAATPALATPALSNTSTLATYLRRNFTAAGITKPNELETRVQAGIVPSAGSSDLTCTFHLVGEGIAAAVDVLSLDPSSQATGLSSASISCTGGSGDASFQGGSALAQFTSNFSGTYLLSAKHVLLQQLDHFLQTCGGSSKAWQSISSSLAELNSSLCTVLQ